MAPVRLAVIGAGAIGRKHIEVMRAVPDCALVALADPMQSAAAVAQQHGVPYFADTDEMLRQVKPDGALIATPNAQHVPAGLACAARGVAMLVEKPIADTLESGRELVTAAERAGVPLLVGHHRRHNPVIQKVRELVRGGAIGRLTTVAAMCLFLKPDDYFEVAWRREPGGGPVLINLIHDIDSLRFICGEIASVQAVTANEVRGFAVEDTAAVTLRFDSGALGTVTLSDAVAAPWSWELTARENAMYPPQDSSCYLFAGTHGALSVPQLDLWRYENMRGWTAPLARTRVDVSSADPLVRQIQHFCDVIRGTAAPLITGADALRTLAATLAVLRAAARGAAIVPG
jgi:predicted dehydrogenase